MFSQIGDTFSGKSVLITGGTGFLGVSLIEKLLRCCPKVKNIYVLVRHKKGHKPSERLSAIFQKEIFQEWDTKLFDKVLAIEGDIGLPNLGIAVTDLETLVNTVSVVFHSAANISFEQNLRTAVNINVLGTRRILELCRSLHKLEALIYVSTAYSNCNRRDIEERVYPSADPQNIIDLCESNSDQTLTHMTHKIIEGFPNSYTFTKGLAETLLANEGQDIPVAIIRPSVVSASWKEPIPGWVDNYSGLSGLMAVTGKGVIRNFYLKKNVVLDIIPVDIVINLMISIVWYMSLKAPQSILVFNCTSGSTNPLTLIQGINMLNPPFSTKYPSSQIYRYPYFKAIESLFLYKIYIFIKDLIPAYIFDMTMHILGRKMIMVNHYNKVHRMANSLHHFSRNSFNFDTKNTKILNHMLQGCDQKVFNLDIKSLNWSTYFLDYWLGIRRHLFKENDLTLDISRLQLKMIYKRDKFITYSLYLTMFVSLILIVYMIL